jgi:hypothetical protein
MIRFHCDILSPVCIHSWDTLDALNSFVDEKTNTCHIIHDSWIEKAVASGVCTVDEIYNALKVRNNQKITEIKNKAFEQWIIDSISSFPITPWAAKKITNPHNAGNIFLHATNHITWKPYIPGSMLKGMLHSLQMVANNDKTHLIHYIAQHTSHADCFIQNAKISIQTRTAKQWMGKKWWKKDGISTIHQCITQWSFLWTIEKTATYQEWQLFDDQTIIHYLKQYQNIILSREKRILDTINKKSLIRHETSLKPIPNQEIVNRCHQVQHNRSQRQKDYDIILKVWFHKKSLTFKNDREHILHTIYRNAQSQWQAWWKFLKNEMLKKWVWDRTMRVDENQCPVWWIWLKIQNSPSS